MYSSPVTKYSQGPGAASPRARSPVPKDIPDLAYNAPYTGGHQFMAWSVSLITACMFGPIMSKYGFCFFKGMIPQCAHGHTPLASTNVQNLCGHWCLHRGRGRSIIPQEAEFLMEFFFLNDKTAGIRDISNPSSCSRSRGYMYQPDACHRSRGTGFSRHKPHEIHVRT